MANFRTVDFNGAVHDGQEAERTLSGYTNDPNDTKERRALLNKEKSKDNLALIFRDCMKVKPGSKYKTRGLSAYYRQLYNKDSHKNTVVCEFFLPLPRTYLGADYHLTGREYKAICNEHEGKPVTDSEALESANKKLLSRDYSDAEKEAIYDFYKKSIRVVCKVFGIKEEDILYAVIHMDESSPHCHFAFLPAVYIQDQKAWNAYQNLEVKGERPKSLYGDVNREIGADEKAVGCSVRRFDKSFLYKLNKRLEDAFKEQDIEVKLSTGKGQYNNVQFTGKQQRRDAAIARALEEEAKRRTADMEAQINVMQAKFDEQYNSNKSILDTQKAENTELKQEAAALKATISAQKKMLNKLRSAIKEAAAELKDIRSTIGDLINNSIRAIKRAFLKGNKKKAGELMDTTTESLLTIQSNVDRHLTDFNHLLEDDVTEELPPIPDTKQPSDTDPNYDLEGDDYE